MTPVTMEFSASINQGLEGWDGHASPLPNAGRTVTVHLKREGKVILPLVYEDEP